MATGTVKWFNEGKELFIQRPAERLRGKTGAAAQTIEENFTREIPAATKRDSAALLLPEIALPERFPTLMQRRARFCSKVGRI